MRNSIRMIYIYIYIYICRSCSQQEGTATVSNSTYKGGGGCFTWGGGVQPPLAIDVLDIFIRQCRK